MYIQFHNRLGWRGWTIIVLALASGLAIMIAVAVVAVSAMIVLVPALALAAAISYLMARFRAGHRQSPTRGNANIIDGEFRIVQRGRDFPRGADNED